MFKFQALNSLFKSLFEKIASVELVCLPDVSAQEIPYLRCIHGHKIGGFRASEGLPSKHEYVR